jgi:hypothetical protein
MQHHRSLSVNGFRLSRCMGLSSLKKSNNGTIESEFRFEETLKFVSSDSKASIKASIEYPPMIHFASTPFFPILKDVLINQGFETPTSIQSRSWPIALKQRDIISVARTGSGKTFGFLLPAFQKLLIAKELEMIETEQLHLWPKRNQSPSVLVLAPTRELALQIEKEANKFRSCGLSTICVYGGIYMYVNIYMWKIKDTDGDSCILYFAIYVFMIHYYICNISICLHIYVYIYIHTYINIDIDICIYIYRCTSKDSSYKSSSRG